MKQKRKSIQLENIQKPGIKVDSMLTRLQSETAENKIFMNENNSALLAKELLDEPVHPLKRR